MNFYKFLAHFQRMTETVVTTATIETIETIETIIEITGIGTVTETVADVAVVAPAGINSIQLAVISCEGATPQ